MSVLEAVRDDRSVRGITLRGRGGVFCAGADLKAFRSGHRAARAASREAVVEHSKRGAGMFDAVNTMPQVVIAMIEGAAMAGGFGLACCADVVICEAGAKFAMTETAIGLIAGADIALRHPEAGLCHRAAPDADGGAVRRARGAGAGLCRFRS